MNNEFTSLVENALDFLEKSIRDLEAGEAKYSVINFYSGLELFLKARLLKEHWALCATNVNKMAKESFASGEFESIGLNDAKARLANIVGCGIPEREAGVYEKLRKRRNQAVHFYHPDDLSSKKRVAVEQLSGWHFLFKRLSQTWKECFDPFLPRLENIHRKISTREEYFPAIFAELKGDIKKQTKQRLLSICDFCGQPSAVTKGELIKSVHRLDCLVCSTETFGVFIPCRKCGKLAPRSFDNTTTCQWCGQSHQANVEESFRWACEVFPGAEPIAWCGECGYTTKQSVIRVGSASLCLACYWLEERAGIGNCQWCGDTVTGELGTCHSPGCARCHYHLAFGETGDSAPEYLYSPSERRSRRWAR